MIKTVLLISALVASVAAFRPASSMSRQSLAKLSMSAKFLPGALAPLGYFDPLGFCKDRTEGEVKVGLQLISILQTFLQLTSIVIVILKFPINILLYKENSRV